MADNNPEIVEPNDFRKQHGRIVRADHQIADSEGGIGVPFRAESLLIRLERREAISPQQRQAGEEFHRLFRLAALDPLHAADPERIPIIGARPAQGHGSAFAHRLLSNALDALGGIASPCGSCAWFVLGCEMSMREWAQRPGALGLPMREEVAKGALLGALGVLAKHFRL